MDLPPKGYKKNFVTFLKFPVLISKKRKEFAMKLLNKSFIPVLLVSFLLISGSYSVNYSQMNHGSGSSNISQADFKAAMRRLWEDHIVWTRNVILNIIDGLDGTDKAV